MRGDLEQNLVDAGLAPTAAKVIANAIANAASPQFAVGQRSRDATPPAAMRMVTADTRKYVLTNLDNAADEPFSRSLSQAANQYQPADRPHPYQGSQPASSDPSLAVPSVAEGDYVQVTRGVTGGVSQSTVSLRIEKNLGSHPRLNPATKAVEAVPFSAEVGQEQLAEAHFEERPEGTVLVINFKRIKKFTISGQTFYGWRA